MNIVDIDTVIKFRRLNFDLTSNTTTSSSSSSRILFEKPHIPLIPNYHSVDNSTEKNDDFVDVESHNHYENDSMHIKRRPSLSSSTSVSTCSPTANNHRSIPIISPIYSHDHQSMKRSRSPSTTDEETTKRVCLTNNTRPVVKNDLRNIESLIERVPEKTAISEPIPASSSFDPNYLYLFYMAQFHNHQKPSLMHPNPLQRYLFYNQQHLQNYYHYPSLTNTK